MTVIGHCLQVVHRERATFGDTGETGSELIGVMVPLPPTFGQAWQDAPTVPTMITVCVPQATHIVVFGTQVVIMISY